MQNSEPIKHHEFSPSRLERFAVCPYAYKNCRGWISQSGKDAQRGTLMHRAIYEDEALAELNQRDRDMVLAVREQYIKPFEGKIGEHYHELYVTVSNESGEIITAGFIDDLMISKDGKTASLTDWKWGNHPVAPAAESDQQRPYVAGIFQKFPKVETVFAKIVQPIFEMDYDKQQAEFHRTDVPALIRRIEKIEDAARKASEADAVINYECKYCNKENCPAYRTQMNNNLAVLSLDRETELLTDEQKEMTVDYADRIMTAKKAIESIMEEKTEDAKKVILDAGGSANFRVQAGRTRRTTDWKALCAEKQITDEEIAQFTTETVGEPFLAPKMRRSAKKQIES